MQSLQMSRVKLLLPLAVLFYCPGLAALPPEDCTTVRQAHQRLLDGSFEVVRTFRMTVNDDLKKREVARLTYSSGKIGTEVLEDEVHSKIMVIDTDGEDFVLEIAFACERLVATGAGRYTLTSEDGDEVAEFELEEETDVLRPIAWRLDATGRMLFKKFVIAGRAEYSDFEWK